jgi:hypothetical protein
VFHDVPAQWNDRNTSSHLTSPCSITSHKHLYSYTRHHPSLNGSWRVSEAISGVLIIRH